jgi:hypothetical protein
VIVAPPSGGQIEYPLAVGSIVPSEATQPFPPAVEES